ncbi:hypothetical protein [Aeromonas hydrophila]|nr:hypothetical protein [Aeromonas hydrophila]
MQTNIKGLIGQLDLSQVKVIDAESMITQQEVQRLQVLEHSPFIIEWGLV